MATQARTEWNLNNEPPHLFTSDHPCSGYVILKEHFNTSTTRSFPTALMLAAKTRSLICCKLLVLAGVELDAKDSKDMTAAMMSVLSGSLECLKVLVKAGTNLDLKDSEGRTAVILAAQSGSVECLQYLLSVQSDIKKVDCGHLLPLLTAVKFNQLDCLHVLLQAGVDPKNSYDCYIPLIMATLTEKVDCLRALIQAGADLNKTNCEGNTALMFAARHGKYEHVKTLVDAGTDTNGKNRRGETALIMAVESSNLQCVSFLIEEGADINASSSEGNTALMFAARDGKYDHVKTLVEAGADIEMRNLRGETALMMAVESSDFQCVSYLIHKGADVSACTSEGNTALIFAARDGKYEHVKILVEAGADINVDNMKGETALMMAAESNSSQCVSYLIHKEADVNASSSEGNTALILAARHGQYEHVKFLVEAGAEINVKNIKDETALIMAVEFNNFQCVSYLIHKGADVSACTSGGLTTFKAAMLNHNTDIMILLLRAPGARGMLFCMGYLDWGLFLKFLLGRDDCSVHRPLNEPFRTLVSSFTDVNVQHIERKTVLLHLLLSSLDAHENVSTSAGHEAGGRGPLEPITDAYIKWVGACVRVLLYTDRINFQDSNGRTALWHAAYAGQHCLPILIQLGANTDIVDENGEPVFMVAINRADSIQIHQLIEGGANLNVRNKEGDTPLVYALRLMPGRQYQAASGEFELMLRRGADVNIRNDFQVTPLLMAVRNPGCSFEMLEMMVMKGADIHALDKNGNSALVHALQSRCDRDSKLDRVTWLLQRGVKPILDDIRTLTRVLGGRYSNNFSVSCHSINELITEGRTDVIRLVVSQGVFPAVSDLSNRHHAAENEATSVERKVDKYLRKQEELFPPFIFALINKRVDIAKYFVLNLYLTQADLAYRVGSDLDSLLDEEGRQFLSSVHSKPWSLVNLALIALSERLGPDVEREDLVVKTCLPVRFQQMLMFQTPMAKLTVNQWKNIPMSSLWKTRQCPPSLAMLAALSCHSAS